MDDFIEYVQARWTRLVRAAVLLGCSTAEAEDIVQATLEKCFVKWAKVSRADDVDAYVHRVLFTTFVSARRRRWMGERPVEHMPEVVAGDDTELVDDADAVIRALHRLAPGQRHVVVLRFYAHLSERQTAAVPGVAPGTVKSRLSRALSTLEADITLRELRGVR